MFGVYWASLLFFPLALDQLMELLLLHDGKCLDERKNILSIIMVFPNRGNHIYPSGMADAPAAHSFQWISYGKIKRSHWLTFSFIPFIKMT